MIRKLDHVAIAVRRIEDRLPFYRDVLGIPFLGMEVVSGERVRVALLGDKAGRIELIEAKGEGSPVERFLRERGEGIHHLCFQVDSMEEACRNLQASGLAPIGGVRSGAEGTRIAFLHPRDTGGVLIELREASSSKEERNQA